MAEVPPKDDWENGSTEPSDAHHETSEARQRRRRRRSSSTNNTFLVRTAAIGAVIVGTLLVVGLMLLPPSGQQPNDETKSPTNKTTVGPLTPPEMEPIYGGYPLAHWEREMELATNEEQIRQSAEALRAFGRKGVPGLVRGLARHKTDRDIPKPIADALAEIGPDGLPELDRLLADRDLKIQKAVPLARLLMKPIGRSKN